MGTTTNSIQEKRIHVYNVPYRVNSHYGSFRRRPLHEQTSTRAGYTRLLDRSAEAQSLAEHLFELFGPPGIQRGPLDSLAFCLATSPTDAA